MKAICITKTQPTLTYNKIYDASFPSDRSEFDTIIVIDDSEKSEKYFKGDFLILNTTPLIFN
jgi:hypothetical protein